MEDGTVAARVDLLGKVIPRWAIEDKLSKLVKTTISVDGKLVHALLDSGTEITVIKKDLVFGISVEGASTIYLKGIFGPAVKYPLVYVPIGLATGGQVNVVHQQVLCALAKVLVEDVLLPLDVLDMLGGAQSKENSLAQSSQDLGVDSGNVDETEVSSDILPEKAQEHIENSQRNITSCRNEVGTLGTKDEEVTAEMDKGSMVADSFRSEQEGCAKLALVWKHAKEDKGNYYEVDGYLFHRDKILGESIGQLLTRSARIKDRSPITHVARPELPFQVVNMDLIGPIDPPSSKGHKYILCLVDQHTRWGEAVPLTSLSTKLLYGRQPQGPLSILKYTWTIKHNNLQLCTTPVSKYLEDLKCKLEKAAEQAKLVSTVQQEKMACYHNLRSYDRVFKVGEKVIVLIPDATSKLFARWQGPATIIEKRNPLSFLVEMPDNSTKHIHQNKLKHYIASSNSVNVIFEKEKEFGQVATPPTATEESKFYEVLNNLKTDNLNSYNLKVLKN
ncbi:retrovirus-related Pol polyprotein from transposon opus [Trichonephila clavipes]|nr:retrovirus-related Pol polyprotein from transposon opus [Trichonephila clavipes]